MCFIEKINNFEQKDIFKNNPDVQIIVSLLNKDKGFINKNNLSTLIPILTKIIKEYRKEINNDVLNDFYSLYNDRLENELQNDLPDFIIVHFDKIKEKYKIGVENKDYTGNIFVLIFRIILNFVLKEMIDNE